MCFYILKKLPHCFSKVVFVISIPPQSVSSSCSAPLRTVGKASLLNFSPSGRRAVVPQCGFIMHFPNTHDAEHLVMCLLVCPHSTFDEVSVQIWWVIYCPAWMLNGIALNVCINLERISYLKNIDSFNAQPHLHSFRSLISLSHVSQLSLYIDLAHLLLELSLILYF